jgi:GNAT superfamily N-acetyltransferase
MKQPNTPFHHASIDLKGCTLLPLERRDAEWIVVRMASMDPWKRLGYLESGLLRYLTRLDPALARYQISVNRETAGVCCIRYPWLRGPFLELFCVLEAFQGKGIGRAALGWMAQEAKGVCHNLWTTASSFNERALAFYRESGFSEAATLKDFLKEGYDEILLRRRI